MSEPGWIPERRLDADTARERYGAELIDRLVAGQHIGDPPADALVAAFAAMPGRAGWRMLDEALEHGAGSVRGAPGALRDLLAPLEEPPAWLDVDRADRGAVTFWRVGAPTLFLTMTYGSLAFGYQSASLVRPLAATGRLETMARRRLGETVRWAMAVTQPGGMRPGAPGWRSTIRVRLVHALVRRHLSRSPDWDHEAWGTPISATDGFATAIGGFFIVPRRAMEDLGHRFSPAELESVAHLWRWIGLVMGVPEDLLPAGATEAEHMMEAALSLDQGPNEDSPRLMRALLHHGLGLDRFLPDVAARPAEIAAGQLLGGFARRWMGDTMADALEVPAPRVMALAPLLRGVTRARDLVRATGLLGSDERIAAMESALVRTSLAVTRAPRRPLQPERAAEAPVVEAA